VLKAHCLKQLRILYFKSFIAASTELTAVFQYISFSVFGNKRIPICTFLKPAICIFL